MPGIENNLYPPIISTWMPAFIRTSACRIYFSLSVYNSVEEIKNVQVIINNQNTNLSALDPKLYPSGIKITSLQFDNSIEGEDKYFITIFPEDLESGIFELNQFYKVQIRFTGTKAEQLTDYKKIAMWLINNQKFFSEWSTVCLVKGIERPRISLKGFDSDNGDENALYVFTSEVVDFIGKLYYQENGTLEKEYLKFYNIKIYNVIDNSLVYDSGDIYTNVYNPNEINYSLKTALEDGVSYKVIFSYTTVNDYKSSVTYLFTIVQNTIGILNARITSTAEEDFGRIKINIVSTVAEIFFGNLIIRRTSSKSNFTVWEDIHKVTIAEGKELDYTWYDYTVESGVWYRYCAQQCNSKGDRGAVITIRYPIMVIFDDMFLTRSDMQIRLRYDPSISSFKKTLLESRTETLGSKFPIIRRNGNVEYRQFPISGLITAFCDEEGLFLNKENIYEDSLEYYNNYNDINNIHEYKDFVYERNFREKVMDFLYENTIKLFRSTTEGNILIKLMDISFTPNQTLGRMLYSFTATAYEIDDCSLEKFNNYGIQYIGDFSERIKRDFSSIGQLQDTYKANEDIIKTLQKKYSNEATNQYVNIVKYLSWLRLEFNMPPYLIKVTENSVEPLPKDEKPTEDTALGYIVYINNEPIVVSARGFYELIDKDVVITSLYFPVDTNVNIDYEVSIDQIENPKLLYKKMFFYTKVGQISDTFNINENVFLKIYRKYLLNYESYHQELLTLNEIILEAVPGTIAYVRDSFSDDFFKHEIGPTGVLRIYDKDTTINGLYFGGVQLYQANSEIDELRENEFREINIGSINDVKEIKNPVKNGVYRIGGKRYIYYTEEWFEFSNDNIVQCPVHVLIDYIYESMKGEY